MRFYLAASGSQPTGDALSQDQCISIQAKRYLDKTPLNVDKIAVEINRISRTIENLNVYVFVTTKKAAQLLPQLRTIEKETGIDIILLDMTDDLSDFGALCLYYWDSIHQFSSLSTFNFENYEWIRTNRNSKEVESRVDSLRHTILKSLHTFENVYCLTADHLDKRFGLNDRHGIRFSYVINIKDAVNRPRIQELIHSWWQSKFTVAYLQGEEGVGKSWLAAAFANKISKEKNLVFWLDSYIWHTCYSLEDLIELTLEQLIILSRRQINKYKNKIMKFTDSPILFILDGVNERNAIRSAKEILSEYFCRKDQFPQVRILFTTRLLETSPGYQKDFWKDCYKISVKQFDNEEFAMALEKFAPDTKPSDFNEELKTIARYPRYFHTCIGLINKIKNVDGITREIVFWETLKEKILDTDYQVYDKLDIRKTQDAEDILSKLARSVNIVDDYSELEIGLISLNECFDDKYSKIRKDLEELRIAMKAAKYKAKISKDHVVLGWALHLRNVLRNCGKSRIIDIYEIIQKELEPDKNYDIKSEALFVALQIILLEQEILNTQINIRVALLIAWASSTNAKFVFRRLYHICNQDISAYIKCVEAIYSDHNYPLRDRIFINALGRVWLNNPEKREVIRKLIRRWLLLVWNEDIPKGTQNYFYEGHELPIARNKRQLYLSSVAISLISLHPELEFIEHIALCLATSFLSKEKLDGSFFPIKHEVFDNLRLLMHWGYTEEILELFKDMIGKTSDELIRKGLYQLTEYFELIEIPEELRMPKKNSLKQFTKTKVVDKIRLGKSVFKSDINEFISGELAHLAVRKDLPDLIPADQEYIFKRTQRYVNDGTLFKIRFSTRELHNFQNWWPWIARLFPNNIAHFIIRIFNHAKEYKFPHLILGDFKGIYPRLKDEDKNDLFRTLCKIKKSSIRQNADYIIMLTKFITEYILLLGTKEEIQEWIIFLEKDKETRYSLFIYPINRMLEIIKHENVMKLAEKRTKEIIEEHQESHNNNEPSLLNYWLYIWAKQSTENENTYKWAEEKLANLDINNNIIYRLFKLMQTTSQKSLWKAILKDNIVQEKFKSVDFRHFSFPARDNIMNVCSGLSYDYLIDKFNPIFVGYLMKYLNLDDDYNRWGKELMEYVNNSIANKVRGDNVSMNKNNYDNHQNEGKLDTWSKYNIDELCEINLIKEWAYRNQSMFIKYAKEYIESINSLEEYLPNLDMISYSIVTALLPFDPTYAEKYIINFSTYGQIRTYYGASEYMAYLWNCSKCVLTKHNEIRQKSLEKAKNDEEIMYICIAALAEGGIDELWKIATEEFIRDSRSKMRCLAVSILPWFASDEAIKELKSLAKKDRSNWVREFATWAIELAFQEKSCRENYREILLESDPYMISVKLQQMKPALLPTALWWRRIIEDEMNFLDKCDNPKIKALLSSFWYHWSSSSKNQSYIRANERELKRYCRGENISWPRHERMAPWWEID